MIVESQFKPHWLLRSPHLQTLWPVWTKQKPPPGRGERLELPDGDFLDLMWFDGGGPLVIVMHGLEGSIESHYAAAVMRALQQNGFTGLFMHFRGCSGEPNRLDRAYHSGETGDFSAVIEHAVSASGKPLHAAIGYSLGGNVLLKWLGEQGAHAPLDRAVAVSVPFRLAAAGQRLERGVSRIYQGHLMKKMRHGYKARFAVRPSPLEVDVDRLETFWQFDDRITAPLHGFSGAKDYYARCSSRQFLKSIRKPTLVIHAEDDPFMFPETVPEAGELSPQVRLELSRHGGHVGFIGGGLRPKRWLEGRIIDYLKEARGVRAGAR
jgi:predicted alpha/beta-fold hydrolase